MAKSGKFESKGSMNTSIGNVSTASMEKAVDAWTAAINRAAKATVAEAKKLEQSKKVAEEKAVQAALRKSLNTVRLSDVIYSGQQRKLLSNPDASNQQKIYSKLISLINPIVKGTYNKQGLYNDPVRKQLVKITALLQASGKSFTPQDVAKQLVSMNAMFNKLSKEILAKDQVYRHIGTNPNRFLPYGPTHYPLSRPGRRGDQSIVRAGFIYSEDAFATKQLPGGGFRQKLLPAYPSKLAGSANQQKLLPYPDQKLLPGYPEQKLLPYYNSLKKAREGLSYKYTPASVGTNAASYTRQRNMRSALSNMLADSGGALPGFLSGANIEGQSRRVRWSGKTPPIPPVYQTGVQKFAEQLGKKLFTQTDTALDKTIQKGKRAETALQGWTKAHLRAGDYTAALKTHAEKISGMKAAIKEGKMAEAIPVKPGLLQALGRSISGGTSSLFGTLLGGTKTGRAALAVGRPVAGVAGRAAGAGITAAAGFAVANPYIAAIGGAATLGAGLVLLLKKGGAVKAMFSNLGGAMVKAFKVGASSLLAYQLVFGRLGKMLQQVLLMTGKLAMQGVMAAGRIHEQYIGQKAVLSSRFGANMADPMTQAITKVAGNLGMSITKAMEQFNIAANQPKLRKSFANSRTGQIDEKRLEDMLRTVAIIEKTQPDVAMRLGMMLPNLMAGDPRTFMHAFEIGPKDAAASMQISLTRRLHDDLVDLKRAEAKYAQTRDYNDLLDLKYQKGNYEELQKARKNFPKYKQGDVDANSEFLSAYMNLEFMSPSAYRKVASSISSQYQVLTSTLKQMVDKIVGSPEEGKSSTLTGAYGVAAKWFKGQVDAFRSFNEGQNFGAISKVLEKAMGTLLKGATSRASYILSPMSDQKFPNMTSALAEILARFGQVMSELWNTAWTKLGEVFKKQMDQAGKHLTGKLGEMFAGTLGGVFDYLLEETTTISSWMSRFFEMMVKIFNKLPGKDIILDPKERTAQQIFDVANGVMSDKNLRSELYDFIGNGKVAKNGAITKKLSELGFGELSGDMSAKVLRTVFSPYKTDTGYSQGLMDNIAKGGMWFAPGETDKTTNRLAYGKAEASEIYEDKANSLVEKAKAMSLTGTLPDDIFRFVVRGGAGQADVQERIKRAQARSLARYKEANPEEPWLAAPTPDKMAQNSRQNPFATALQGAAARMGVDITKMNVNAINNANLSGGSGGKLSPFSWPGAGLGSRTLSNRAAVLAGLSTGSSAKGMLRSTMENGQVVHHVKFEEGKIVVVDGRPKTKAVRIHASERGRKRGANKANGTGFKSWNARKNNKAADTSGYDYRGTSSTDIGQQLRADERRQDRIAGRGAGEAFVYKDRDMAY